MGICLHPDFFNRTYSIKVRHGDQREIVHPLSVHQTGNNLIVSCVDPARNEIFEVFMHHLIPIKPEKKETGKQTLESNLIEPA